MIKLINDGLNVILKYNAINDAEKIRASSATTPQNTSTGFYP
ncbi:MAG: hypothetical protein AABX03_02860 [Nanoarchaeota archaeon]